ncbi:MAG: HNH endonuclease [Gemmatimonadaceae bacterium]|jgi:5-methylcytosine-specific restriction endonuclease McrA|nr:HNH endonuclease [Gemmatimonadaceae bacterium]
MTQSERLSREALFARDGYRCAYCGQVFPPEELTVDHVEPRVRGGDHSGGNVVSACGACNLRKGHRRLADFLAEEPEARRNFFRLARYIWPRHRRAVAEALGKRGIGVDD